MRDFSGSPSTGFKSECGFDWYRRCGGIVESTGLAPEYSSIFSIIIRYTYILLIVMSKTKVTDKFQITIPKEIRSRIGLKPGEVVIVESIDEEQILVKRFRRVKDPLTILIGKTPYKRHAPIKELEERVETR